MEIKKVTAYTKPKFVDVDSSPTTVFVCKNIKEFTDNINIGGVKKIVPKYEYTMYSYSRSEFELVEQFVNNDKELESVRGEVESLREEVAELKEIIKGGGEA